MALLRRMLVALLAAMLVLPGIAFLCGQIGVWRGLAKSSLTGVTPAVHVPPPSWAALEDHSFQRQAEAWLAERLGRPRDRMIRINNGIGYLFGRSAVHTIIIGRDGVLHERDYVKDWCERAPADMRKWAAEIADIQDAVRRAGKAFVLLVSPSKTAVYPETLPDGCRPPEVPRPYDLLMSLLRQRGIATVDGHALALRLRREQPWPVFGRDGVHWNQIGAGAAVAAVYSVLEGQMGRALPRLTVRDVVVDRRPVDDEDDLGRLLNLAFTLRPVSPHPVFAVERRGTPPRLLVVGSSFNWQPLRVMQRNGLMGESTFLYYFSSTARYAGGRETFIGSMSPTGGNAGEHFAEAFAAADAVILEVNESMPPTTDYVTRFHDALLRLTGHTPLVEARH
jgi:hypothetical protein